MVYSIQSNSSARQSYVQSDSDKEVVGVFIDINDLQDTIRELEGSMFPRQDISVMGSRADLEKTFGSKTVDPEAAINNSNTPRQAPSRPEEQTIGVASVIGGSAYVGAMALAFAAGAISFPAIISAAVIGGISGGTLGAILSKLLGDKYTRHIEQQIEKGGLLLWVRTKDVHAQETAKQIMIINNGYDVHAHSAS